MNECQCSDACEFGYWPDQFQPATRELMVFTKSPKRYFDLDAVRHAHKDGRLSSGGGSAISAGIPRGIRGDLQSNPSGAPPLDWWHIDPADSIDIPEGQPMTATFYVGDAIQVMNRLTEKSVDLILTSPPFLALRSYLPTDHPDKALEGGSQATPRAYIDWLVDVVEACDRVLALHGSMCIELGDTYAGSSAFGGDELRGGIQLTGRNQKRGEVADIQRSTTGWPLAKSLSLIPELFRTTLVYDTNPLTGRSTERWRLRNVIRWVRPNPPVGALGDKFRPATSELMVFCKSAKRFFDLDAVRDIGSVERNNGRPETVSTRASTGSLAGTRQTWDAPNPAGAPPLDWWNIPPGGYEGAHYAVWPPELLIKPIKAMCPSLVCLECGPIYDLRTLPESGATAGMGAESAGTEQGLHDSSGLHHGQWYAGSSDGDGGGVHLPTSASDGGASGADASANGGRSPQEWNQERQPNREPGSYGQGSSYRSRDDRSSTPDSTLPPLRRSSEFLRHCPRCNGVTRPGLVLDPFVGSGTTLAVATGHGRDAIGIDLDARNYELALDRVGPLILQRGEATV